MPRQPRMYVAGLPSHVIQRGNNRQVCFFGPDDYRRYLTFLEEACARYRVAVHAYVLMTNHVHLLMTPTDTKGISRVIQSLGRCYVQYVNHVRGRSGTLWEGRHKASLVHADRYLLACYRYIELNPVRAGMVTRPGDYPWSSYRRNARGVKDTLVQEHSLYTSLGSDPERRRAGYRMLFNAEFTENELNNIRVAAQGSTPLGDERFQEEVALSLGREPRRRTRGRPRKGPLSV